MENVTMELIGQMMEIKTKYDVLINYLINSARLNYNKTSLSIDDCSEIIQALEPKKYDARFDILQANENE